MVEPYSQEGPAMKITCGKLYRFILRECEIE